MERYLVLYRTSTSAEEQMAGNDPEQAAAGMEAWMAWAARAGDAIVDLGTPLAPVGTPQGDGYVGGYSILQAADDEGVLAVLEGHPHTAWGGTIEIHRALALPGV